MLKFNGFNVDSYESVGTDNISFYLYNEGGNYIYISWNERGFVSVDLEKAE